MARVSRHDAQAGEGRTLHPRVVPVLPATRPTPLLQYRVAKRGESVLETNPGENTNAVASLPGRPAWDLVFLKFALAKNQMPLLQYLEAQHGNLLFEIHSSDK